MCVGGVRAANWYTIWVHVSMLTLAGFAFLYTFMRKYAYTAIGHVFLITVLTAQWCVPASSSIAIGAIDVA